MYLLFLQLLIGSPCCTDASREIESKSDILFPSQPRHNLAVMKHPIKDCILTKIEREAGSSGIKTWRKSILLVWREATQHKYANVFLNPVTNEEAPGYRSASIMSVCISMTKYMQWRCMVRRNVHWNTLI